MKRRTHFLSSFIILLVIGIYFFNRKPDDPVVVQERAEEPVNNNLSKTPVVENTPSRSISSITKKDLQAFREAYPYTTDVKTEAENLPHKTPASIINFAQTLGPLYEKALRSETDATLLVKELETCTMNDSVALSARTLCLSKADQLAGVYPGMQKEVRDLHARAPDDVNQLLEKKTNLLKR